MSTRSKTKVRYAVVGLGHIAQIAVLPAFRNAKANSEVTALVTGTPKKARALSKRYRVENVYSYDEYDDMLRSGIADAVYIALPNDQHVDFACRALEAGLHVLCEKPLAVSVEECRKMIAASEKSGAKLMTAYRLHFDKPNIDAIQLCRKRLGPLKSFTSSFSYVVKDKENIRLQPTKGSGPLWDIGIYCINAARYLFAENPIEVIAFETRQPTGPFSKVPETISAILRFPDEKLGSFTCSFHMAESSYFEVYGEKGMVRLQNAYEYAFPPEMHTLLNGKKAKKTYKKVDQFAAELLYFASCIQNDRVVEPSGEEGLIDVAIMEAVEESIRSHKPVRVDYAHVGKTATPRPGMAERKPAVRKPKLVDVQSASGD